jgi:hypothetical protein
MGEGHNFKMSNSTQTEKRGGYKLSKLPTLMNQILNWYAETA